MKASVHSPAFSRCYLVALSAVAVLCTRTPPVWAASFEAAHAVPVMAAVPPVPPAHPSTSRPLDATSTAAAEASVALWHRRYAAARVAFAGGRYAEAARELEAIQDLAPTPEWRLLAHELGFVARESQERQEAEADAAPDVRSADEMSVLYATSFLYGLGTSAWVTLQVRPNTISGAILPFALITTAAVGGVSVADGYRPLRRGVPQSIAAGLYLGFGEGVWIVGYQQAVASRLPRIRRWRSETVSTVLWTASTAVGIGGGIIGAIRQPTPGRVSYTSSTTVWGGVLAGFAGSALQTDRARRAETAMLSAGVGYNLGLLGGLLTSPSVSPSVARVRFVDLGGMGGGLLGAGVYALADEQVRTSGLLGAMAIGSTVGLVTSWWATSDMPRDLGPPEAARVATGTLPALQPLLAPLKGGWLVGVSGAL